MSDMKKWAFFCFFEHRFAAPRLEEVTFDVDVDVADLYGVETKRINEAG